MVMSAGQEVTDGAEVSPMRENEKNRRKTRLDLFCEPNLLKLPLYN